MSLALRYGMGDVHHCSGTPRLRNDLYCVEWDVKPYYTIPYHLQCSDTIGWAAGRASDLYKVGCWFVGDDDLTGALHDLQLQLSPPLTSSLASIKPD